MSATLALHHAKTSNSTTQTTSCKTQRQSSEILHKSVIVCHQHKCSQNNYQLYATGLKDHMTRILNILVFANFQT